MPGSRSFPKCWKRSASCAIWKRQQNLSYLIEIDGSCNQRTYRDLMGAGAEVLIVGSSGLFNLDPDLETAWEKMLDQMRQAA